MKTKVQGCGERFMTEKEKHINRIISNLVQYNNMTHRLTKDGVTKLYINKKSQVSIHSRTIEEVMKESEWFTIDSEGLVTIIWKK